MIRARVTLRARRDLREAAGWIHEDNPATAEALVAAFEAAMSLLAKRPALGHRRPDVLSERYRFWRLRGFSYLVVYSAAENPPTIVRLLHTSRDLPPQLSGLDD